MSGYCPDCGNTACICKGHNFEEVEFPTRKTLQDRIKVLEGVCKEVAEDYLTETEYDGKVIEYCFYCNSTDGHEKDCTHIKAKNLLNRGK